MGRKKCVAVVRKRWTPEDEALLQERWGESSIKSLAKFFNRTENAIMIRAQRLGLGPHLEGDHRVSVNQVMLAIYGGKARGKSTLDIWIREGLPVKRHRVRNCTFKVIDIDDFWRWAEQHKNLLSFAEMEVNVLGAEPDWVKEKRRIDIRERLRNSSWTPFEDAQLKCMLDQNQFTYDDMSRELKRSEGAIKRRICDLGLPQRPIRRQDKPWSNQEENTLLRMKSAGHSFEKIGEILGRSALAVRGKLERFQNPEYMKRYLRRQREDMQPFFQKDMCQHFVKTIGCTAGGTNCDDCRFFSRRDPDEPRNTGWSSISEIRPDELMRQRS